MSDRLKLGISTCLLGEKVRYDGQHKRDHYLCDILGQFVEWVPVCPEVECGMSIPREAMRLVGDPDNPRLMTINSKKDLTPMMEKWIAEKLAFLENQDLCGYIFKSKSPSSGLFRVKIYTEKGFPSNKGAGLFAKAFTERFPLLPVEEEGRLHDSKLRENFIEKVYCYYRWQQMMASDPSIRDLEKYHRQHKLLLMAHSPSSLRQLGQLIANKEQRDIRQIADEYLPLFVKTLSLQATIKKNTNVLHHILGYFKKQLSADEKQEMLEIIDQYYASLVPLIVPVTMCRHFVRKYNDSYLCDQHYLYPHPDELMLRNHV